MQMAILEMENYGKFDKNSDSTPGFLDFNTSRKTNV